MSGFEQSGGLPLDSHVPGKIMIEQHGHVHDQTHRPARAEPNASGGLITSFNFMIIFGDMKFG